MNKKCNTFSFCMKDYEEYNEYPCKEEINESSMWEDIATFIRIAMKNGYCLKVHFDGLTVIIEYNYDDPGMGDPTLEWVGEDEYIEKIRSEIEGESE